MAALRQFVLIAPILHPQFVVAALVTLASADHINKNAQIRSSTNDVPGDGSYSYGFDTTNGISVHENGAGGQVSNGDASWVSPEGEQVRLTWTADANGYHPAGSHLPTPPPVPAAILRALEWIRTHPSAEQQPLLRSQLG